MAPKDLSRQNGAGARSPAPRGWLGEAERGARPAGCCFAGRRTLHSTLPLCQIQFGTLSLQRQFIEGFYATLWRQVMPKIALVCPHLYEISLSRTRIGCICHRNRYAKKSQWPNGTLSNLETYHKHGQRHSASVFC